ncbi:MAG: TetR/AcrR family transcriptional regulator [bacterium]|nr:TetR/AcrR family transcriptional regulator [bacterium]
MDIAWKLNFLWQVGKEERMGITERKEREKREMERSILDAAMKLFVEDGYEKVSIRRIAEEIEYSPATIYSYFEDKDEILYRLHEEGFEKLIELQKAVQSIADPMQRLHKRSEAYVDFGINNPQYYELMFIMTAPMCKVKDDDWGCGCESFGILKADIRDCAEAGLLEIEDLDIAAATIWSLCHGLVSLIIRGRMSMIPEEILPEVIAGVINFKLNGETINKPR